MSKLKNKLNNITRKRIKNALRFDQVFKNNPNVKTVKRFSHYKEVYHLYHINVKKRDKLQQYLIKNGVDAKVHYPIPIHLQPAAKYLKYKKIKLKLFLYLLQLTTHPETRGGINEKRNS